MNAGNVAGAVNALVAEHERYRARCLNLVASENIVSPAVAFAGASDLEGRYADYQDNDPMRRKYRGGDYISRLEALCSDQVCRIFGAEACELRAISGHVAGSAVLLAFCEPGDLVMEVGPDGGGHRLATKLAEPALIDLRTEFLPFDSAAFTVDAASASLAIRERSPRVVVLGSSSFVRPHPIRDLVSACQEVGAILVYDASHVMGFVASGRFQDPLREGADIVFGSTHKTLCGPQGGLIFGRADLVSGVGSALYPALVTSHHPARIPALAVALAEHEEFGGAYVDGIVRNATAFEVALRANELDVVGAPTESHTVLVATPGRAEASASDLESKNVICNQTRLPDDRGREGLRFGLQEFTKRGGDVDLAARAGNVAAAALRGEDTAGEVAEITERLQTVAFTWPS
jgi:glycine hydroxymethyltransferase